jgi:integrase
MALKGQYTTADYLPWSEAMQLVKKLYRDGRYRDSILVATGLMTGLRISDILRLTFADILNGDMLIINEKKTGKRREIPLSKDYQKHVEDCFKALGLSDTSKPMFLSYQGSVITIQMVNKTLHGLKDRYNLSVENFTSHSLRKTFARRIYDTAKDREYALIKLSSVLGHSNVSITRRYLGIKREEILDCYAALDW